MCVNAPGTPYVSLSDNIRSSELRGVPVRAYVRRWQCVHYGRVCCRELGDFVSALSARTSQQSGRRERLDVGMKCQGSQQADMIWRDSCLEEDVIVYLERVGVSVLQRDNGVNRRIVAQFFIVLVVNSVVIVVAVVIVVIVSAVIVIVFAGR